MTTIKPNNFSKKENKNLLNDYLFYLSAIFLACSVFATLILNFKVNLQHGIIEDIEGKSLSLGTGERQVFNTKVLDYKRKIDDFATLIKSHKINSNVFTFIEEKTLPNVWFSTFLMQGEENEIRLSGQAQNMQALSAQLQVLENSKEEVEKVSVLESQINAENRIEFTLNIILNPKVFRYQSESLSLMKNKSNP